MSFGEENKTLINKSYMQEMEIQPKPEVKMSDYTSFHQIRGLFYKNIKLQMRQFASNIIQLVTPIIGLLIIKLLESLARSQIEKLSANYSLEIPIIMNLPYSAFTGTGAFLNITNCDQWYLIGFDPNASQSTKDYIGKSEGIPMDKPVSNGMFTSGKNIIQGKCPNVSRQVPYFNISTNSTDEILYNTISYLNTKPMNYMDPSSEVEELHLLPDGAITFRNASKELLDYNLQIDDIWYNQYHRNNGITKLGIVVGNMSMFLYRTIEGQIFITDLVNRAYARSLFPDTWIFSSVQNMPMNISVNAKVQRALDMVGVAIFPFCLCFLLPVFLFMKVQEKEDKLIEIMKMNGMKTLYYWIVNIIFDFMNYAITIVFFVLFGYFVMRLKSFVSTSFGLQILMFIGWGFAQISMAFALCPFLKKAYNASLIGYIIALWFTVIAVTCNLSLFEYPKIMNKGLNIIPYFSFSRIYYRLARGCANDQCITSLNQLDGEVIFSLVSLYLVPLILFLIGIYFHLVVPQEYGVAKHPLFFISYFMQKSNDQNQIKKPDSDEEVSTEEEDVFAERQKVEEVKEVTDEYPLLIKNMYKTYEANPPIPEKKAVRNITLAVKKGEIFGLLGPNGAGKTTLISILTGLYKPTFGEGKIGGFDIREELAQVQRSIGVCPQFDLLWNDLTVSEHLYFYARMKGIDSNNEEEFIDEILKGVDLLPHKYFLTKNLSLGMKRRLSIAISLIGNPKIVFLDEPTTGLDPETRRHIWNIISDLRGKFSLLLTTHSMEEADALCTRIGIVTDGKLRCLGNQLRLKNKFGGGYRLIINCYQQQYLKLLRKRRNSMRKRKGEEKVQIMEVKEEDNDDNELLKAHQFTDEELSIIETWKESEIHEKAIDFIQKAIPSSTLNQSFNGNFVFEIPIKSFNLGELFSQIESNKKKLLISDWGISQCSLEDVFTRICKNIRT